MRWNLTTNSSSLCSFLRDQVVKWKLAINSSSPYSFSHFAIVSLLQIDPAPLFSKFPVP